MPTYAFLTVTDYAFFPGTLATVNSVLRFHPNADVFVAVNHKNPLTAPQVQCLQTSERVRLIDSRELAADGRHINAWELKAYAAAELLPRYDVFIGIDSDCLLCSDIEDEILACHGTGGFIGGADGNGLDYDDSYGIYGINTPVKNPKYMSTSLFFVANTPQNRSILERWCHCCNSAVFNGTGSHPGHGDQGVLNAVMYAEGATDRIRLLPNHLWSQHWVYWDSIIAFREGEFRNLSASGQRQRSFHCGGAEKFWAMTHRERILSSNPLQTYPYLWFLSQFWFGPCRLWSIDPWQYLPEQSHHLLSDLIFFLPQIMPLNPEYRERWNEISDQMIDRAIAGVPRFLSLGGGAMTEIIELIAANRSIRRFVEVGGYEGGSILTLGIRFLNRDIDFYSVESFAGSYNNTMDGHRLPTAKKYVENFTRFPSLRTNMVLGDSGDVAQLFEERSVNCVFIDACHETDAVIRDIDAWISRVIPGGFIAGDDYHWPSVRAAVNQRFATVNVTPSGCVWWTPILSQTGITAS